MNGQFNRSYLSPIYAPAAVPHMYIHTVSFRKKKKRNFGVLEWNMIDPTNRARSVFVPSSLSRQ